MFITNYFIVIYNYIFSNIIVRDLCYSIIILLFSALENLFMVNRTLYKSILLYFIIVFIVLETWPTFLVTDYIDILPICNIVNLSLSEGVVIDKFKHAVVTPLFKNLPWMLRSSKTTGQCQVLISYLRP